MYLNKIEEKNKYLMHHKDQYSSEKKTLKPLHLLKFFKNL